MADVTARSVEITAASAPRRVALRVIPGAAGSGQSPPLSMRLPVLPPLLSQPGDFLGIGPVGWLGALGLYLVAAGLALWLAWQATPPQPWPETPAAFRVIFEEPPAPPVAEVAPAPPVEPEQVVSEPPPEPVPTVAETPAPIELPPPPPPKPALRHAAVTPHPAPPALAPPPPTAEAPAPPPQVAALPVLPPRPISGLAGNPKPDYPAQARQRGVQGRVVLRVEVSATGLPLGITVASSSGHAILDQAARAAVEHWRFSPATQGGAPVAGTADVPVQFRLED